MMTTAGLCAALLSLSVDASFEKDVRPFLKKHCLSCHGPEKQQSGVRFDRATGYRAEEATLWTKAHTALEAGTMPPSSRPRPPAAELKRLLSWVEQNQLATPGKIRRLNRREASAALQDVTGLSVDYAHGLPGDGKLGGFDTGADALQDAADSVAQFMTITRRAVDAVRFLDKPSGKVLSVDLSEVGERDARKAFDSWKAQGAVFKAKGFKVLPGKGMLLEPRWVGDRDAVNFNLPTRKGGRGVLRLKLLVSAYKPMPGLPSSHLWVKVGGRYVAYEEVTATPEKPRELVYEVQLDDLAIEAKGAGLSLRNVVEVPYAVKGYENEEKLRPGEVVPGGTGLFRPEFNRRLPPGKQPVPFLVVHHIEVSTDHVALWPPAHWKAKIGPVKDGLASAKELLKLWAERAWRRPVADVELKRFVALYEKLRGEKSSFDDALRGAFQAVLMSSGFRYLASPADRDATVAQHAVASRLSFMLWGAPPDAELLRLAAAGKLKEPAVLEAQVGRLLASPRSDGFFRPFVVQWLEMEQPITIASEHLKKQDFRWARYMKSSMKEETIAYVARLFRDDRPARELVESDWTMMNDVLAVHYGYGGVEGGHLRKVPLRKDDPRGGGVLGHAGIQSMLCWMGGNWVVYRGAWAMRHILDDPPPPPPLEVPELNPTSGANRGKTFKELLKKHQEEANCAVCHRKMDPIGYAFQNFDISGRWRDKEYESYVLKDLDGKIEWHGSGKARPVDTVGKLPRGEEFRTFAECKQLIVKNYQADLMRGILKNLVVYGTGRLPDVHDLAELRKIMKGHQAKGYPLRGMLKALVRSRLFLER